jgi:hypothetical protein
MGWTVWGPDPGSRKTARDKTTKKKRPYRNYSITMGLEIWCEGSVQTELPEGPVYSRTFVNTAINLRLVSKRVSSGLQGNYYSLKRQPAPGKLVICRKYLK